MQNKKNIKKILLTGGGTGGSVSPLLAIAEELKKSPNLPSASSGHALYQGGYNFLWIGTKNGPEREMVASGVADSELGSGYPEPSSSGRSGRGIKFKAIYCGKFRRYFSLRNFIDPFLILIGFFQSFFIILKWRPDLVISAGSFVSVPAVLAAWILRTPVLIHQQDARPGLANKLMAPFAKVVTTAFEESLKHYGKKAVWTGNPARELRIKNYACPEGNFGELRIKNKNNMPTILVIGGGTGATAINKLVWDDLNNLTKFCQIIHITGKDKCRPRDPISKSEASDLEIGSPSVASNYDGFEFLNSKQMAEAYAAADIVVSRCGMGVLTELSYLGKPAILIPMPDSHQEDNAKIFKEKDAAIVLNQKELTPKELTKNVKELLDDEVLRGKLRNNIKGVIKRGANESIVGIIKKLLESV